MHQTPRLLHPGAWWLWALGLAACASFTTNPLLLAAIVAVTGIVVSFRRVPGPWGATYSKFLWLAVFIILIRLVLQILLGTNPVGTVLFTLPSVPLPEWLAGISLGGPTTADGLLHALYDGMRLATILICVGAANSLVNPSRLLRIIPAALYEVGVAIVICLTVTPILVTDVGRIRRARRLRGRTTKGLKGVGEIALPLIGGALDQSINLAASMDSRGYGRSAGLSRGRRAVTGALVLLGLLGVSMGLYGLLQGAELAGGVELSWPLLVFGCVLAVAGASLAGARLQRTKYRPDVISWPEFVTVACGVIPIVVFALSPDSLLNGFASPPTWPSLSLPLLLALVVAALPAGITPVVPSGAQTRTEVTV